MPAATPRISLCARARDALPSAAACAVAAALSALVACAPSAPKARRQAFPTAATQAAPTQAEEAEARRLWEGARRAAEGRDEPGAQAMRDAVLQRLPNTEAAAWIYEARAHEAMQAGHKERAVAQLEHILYLRPQYAHIGRIREAYATALVQTGRAADALALWQSLSPRTQADARRRMGLALMKPLAEAGQSRGALQVAMEVCHDSAIDGGQREEIASWAIELAKGVLPLSDAEALWQQYGHTPSWRPVAPILALRLAKSAAHNGDAGHSNAYLTALARDFADTPYAAAGQQYSQMLQAQKEVDATAVGVLLPLTGRYKQFGERSRVAIELAMSQTPGIKLVVKDTQGDASQAAQALEALVFEHHVVATIGPLFSAEAMAAAVKAEELGVPLMSLSHRDGLSDVGPYIFRSALSVEAQARGLAKMAFEQLGMARFALLYPRSRYGMDFVQAFWDEVDRRHGEIRGVESYEPQQTTFREPVRRLVGRWYLNARPEIREATAGLKSRNLSNLRLRSEMQRLEKGAPPLVDFDGLVIPDSGRQLGLIAPAVAFEDIVLAHNPRAQSRMRRATNQSEAQAVTLLGASTWNSVQTLDSCEQYCEDGVFVDAYWAGSPDVRVRDFVRAFNGRAGTDPYLSEAQAYDTAGLLARVLMRARPRDRAALKDAILAAEPYIGVTGRTQFDAHGEAQKELFTLTIRNHQIEQLTGQGRARR